MAGCSKSFGNTGEMLSIKTTMVECYTGSGSWRTNQVGRFW